MIFVVEIKIPGVRCTDGSSIDIFLACEMLGDDSGYSIFAAYTKKETDYKIIEKIVIPGEYKGVPIVYIEETIISLDTSIFLGDNVYYIGKDFCSEIISLELPDSIEYVEANAFAYTNIKNIRWSSSCDEIEEETFSHSALEHLTNIDNVVSIQDGAFNGCKKLESIKLPETCKNIKQAAFCNCALLKTFHWPEYCSSIPDRCFEGCYNLKLVENFSTVDSIGDRAFYNSGVEEIRIYQNCKKVGESCFEKCENLKKVYWNKGIKKIPLNCFTYCESLSLISNIEDVTEIDDNAFAGTGITNFIWPLHCNVISYGCFEGSSLKKVSFHQNIKAIEDNAFLGTLIEDMDLSQTLVMSIGKNCFPIKANVKLPYFLV